MMFLLDGAFAIELIALALGTVLLIWASRNQGNGVALGKTIGSIIFILSILVIICTGYYGLRYWAGGYLEPSSNISMDIRAK